MGTCEEGNNPPQINGISPEISSNGSHHNSSVDHQDQDQNQTPLDETPTIVEKLETLELKGSEEEEEEGGKVEIEETHDYPLRPNSVNCTFYMKTGTCKFGLNCRFNHPPNRAIHQGVEDTEKVVEDSNGSVSDIGKIDCKYFSTPGGCKYGDACRYNHSQVKIDTQGPELNFLGLPIRPLEKECTYYMRNGSCKYGANCRFNHPDPSSTKESDGNSLANGGSLRGDNNFRPNYGPSRSSGMLQGTLPQQSNGMNLRDSVPYVTGMSSYHHGMLQNPAWIQNQVTLPTTNMPPLPHQLVNGFPKTSNPPTLGQPLMQSEEFPVRPGQPNCDYFMKNGDCKYRSACRYNHPSSRAPKLPVPPLSTTGPYPRSATILPVESTNLLNPIPNNTRKNGVLYNHQQMQNGEFPERPGQPECEYFMKTGNCKFRSACRYHHPRNRVSTSSPPELSEKGLPLRPGSRICRNYEQQGTCKYGQNCLFHHPDDISSTGEFSSVAASQDHSSTVVTVTAAADSELLPTSNEESSWGDGWDM